MMMPVVSGFYRRINRSSPRLIVFLLYWYYSIDGSTTVDTVGLF
jgi:hypothetical protein